MSAWKGRLGVVGREEADCGCHLAPTSDMPRDWEHDAGVRCPGFPAMPLSPSAIYHAASRPAHLAPRQRQQQGGRPAAGYASPHKHNGRTCFEITLMISSNRLCYFTFFHFAMNESHKRRKYVVYVRIYKSQCIFLGIFALLMGGIRLMIVAGVHNMWLKSLFSE